VKGYIESPNRGSLEEMAQGDGVTEHERETAEEEDALLHFSRYAEARQALPWDQKTRREKITYYTDRCFLIFVIIFLSVLFGEAMYKAWWVSNGHKIKAFLFNFATYLFAQEEGEDMIEL
jgi:CBS domain containing-hemolysin-like protein